MPAPHYRSNDFESELMNRVVEYLDREGLPYKRLRDGQAIYVDGAREDLLGAENLAS